MTLVAVCASPRALAQPFPAAPPAPPYQAPAQPYPVVPPLGPAPIPLLLEGDRDELRMVLSLDPNDPPFVRCRGQCAISVLPGRYTLTVGATREVSEQKETLELEQPSRVKVSPQPASQHPLALAGFITLLAGGGVLAVSVASEEDSARSSSVGAGLIAIVVGLVMIPIGAGLSRDDHLDVQVEPL